MKKLVLLSIAAVLVLSVGGCKKGGGIDADKTTTEVKAEAPTLSVDQLTDKVDAYTKAIAGKEEEVNKIMADFKALDMTKMASEEGKKLQAEIEQVATSLKTLQEHLGIYKDALDEKMKTMTEK